MKTATVMAALFAFSSIPCGAEEIWLLASRGGSSELMYSDAGGLKLLATAGDRTFYGTSGSRIGVVSRVLGTARAHLMIVDVTKHEVSADWPIMTYPAAQLSGPTRDLVLQGDFAYFVSMPAESGRIGAATGSEAASYVLNKVSLVNGMTQELPIPTRCGDPRLLTGTDAPTFYCSNSLGLWKLDSATSTIRPLDQSVNNVAGKSSQAEIGFPGARFSDPIALPAAGVYRAQSSGVIHRISSPNTQTQSVSSDSSVGTALAADVRLLIPTSFHGRPSVGAVRQSDGQISVSTIDPDSGSILREIRLTQDAVPESAVSSADESVVFVDSAQKTVLRATDKGKTEELLSLATVPDASVHLTRIVEVVP